MIQELVHLKVVCDGCGAYHRWEVYKKDLENKSIGENFVELFYHCRIGGASVYSRKWYDINGRHYCSKKCEGKRSVRFDVGEEFLEGVIEQATKQLSYYKKTEE